MREIEQILSIDSNATDNELKEYFIKHVRNILNEEFKKYGVAIEYDQYPSLMFTRVDEEDSPYKTYSLDAYYYINDDDVYVAEIILMSDYDRDFNEGDTFIELNRLEEYELKDTDNSISASVESPFEWKEVTRKLMKNEGIKELVKY